MDGFNSKEFYGHSWSDDPKLRTTTRNYEFKYNSSDHLERVINRVRIDREKKKEFELLNQFSNTPTNHAKIIKMPSPTTVETQIGSSKTVVKIMSDEEIDEMISQALQSKDNTSNLIHCPEEITSPSNALKDQEEIETDEKLPQMSMELFPDFQPQWVEIIPVQKSIANLRIIEDSVFVASHYAEDSSGDSDDLSDLNLGAKSPERNINNFGRSKETSIRKKQFYDALSFGSGMSEDFIIRNQESALKNDDNVCNDHEVSPQESLISLDIESSLNESEHLEMERVFEQIIPHAPKSKFQELESQEMSDLSECSYEEDDTEIQDPVNFEVEGFDEGVSTKRRQESKEQVQKRMLEQNPIEPLPLRSEKSSAPITPKKTPIQKSPKLQNKEAKPLSSNRKTPMDLEKLKVNISIEDLKKEKLRIFSKMTSIQENIIKNLDTLRISLVEKSLPDGEVERKLRERNALEFSVRFSRNYLFPLGKMIDDLRSSPKEEYHSALTNEPCVKVCGIYGLLSQAIQCYQKQLRHFFTDCFPKKLDTLLNLIRDTTIICLEKQIFDKRDTLIQELISRCEMFLGFVFEFAEKKKSARNEMALQSERRSRFKLPKTSSKWDLTMNLNNLNMYEPKLVQKKAKKTPQKKIPKPDSHRVVSKSKKTKKMIPKDSIDIIATFPCDDLVETQVRKDSNVDSVQLINDVIAEEPASDLAKAVIETLQDITKDEVHHMFGPIVSNLNSIVKSSDNPQTAVESVLNVLKLKLQEARGISKQLKIDEIATENNTQNSNSYQKEVTKKGTHSSKGKQQKQKQQQQQFKETRENKVSSKAKTKVTVTDCSSSKNAKEDSTEQTKRYSRYEPTDTRKTTAICDNKSLRNIDFGIDNDDVAVAAFFSENENNSMKQKTCGGAFLSTTTSTTTTTTTTMSVAAAKKPTPAPDTKEVGGIAAAAAAAPQPLTPPLSILPVKLDDVMPPTPPPLPSRYSMTSGQCLDYSTPLPVGLPRLRLDKFVSQTETHKIIGDGIHRNRIEVVASQRNVRDGAANAIEDRAEEACRKNLPVAATASTSSPVRNESTKSGEMEKLYYRSNALYTFVKYLESNLTSDDGDLNLKNQNNLKEIKTRKDEDDHDLVKTDKEYQLETSHQEIFAGVSAEKEQDEEIRNKIDIKAILEERNDFIERCKGDPFYTNPQFPQPWKVLSKISKVIAREIVENFESDLSFGEESYIRDFIDMEVQT